MTVVTGHCLCGVCRYEHAGPLEPGGICYCEDCRRVTGSAFGVSFRADKANLKRFGLTMAYPKIADSGARLTRHFCKFCGSPMYTLSDAHPDSVYVKAGTLNDPNLLTIDRQMWLCSRVAWSQPPPDIQSFDKGRT